MPANDEDADKTETGPGKKIQEENVSERNGDLSESALEDEEFFPVKGIVEEEHRDDGLYYLVHWEGYDNPEDYTWEPSSHLEHCVDIILSWEKTKAGGRGETRNETLANQLI